MEDKKIRPWNLNNNEDNTLKNIVPGDEVNQNDAVLQAQAAMADSMAKEIRQDSEYKEKLQDLPKQASNIEQMALGGTKIGSSSSVDQTVSLGLGYVFIRILRFFIGPVPGAPDNKFITFLTSVLKITATGLGAFIVIRWLLNWPT